MELTILLAKVLGSFMVIAGVLMVMRKRFFMSAFASVVEDKGVRYFLAVIDIGIGLLIVNTHNDWSSLPAGIISLVGWMALLKGVLGAYLKDSTLEKFATSFREKKWYVPEAFVVVVVGLYLMGFGYNWF